jgi:polysaccharide deacetylase family protein (PEP-CTERM system associated)
VGDAARGRSGELERALLLSFDLEDWHQLVHRQLGLEGWDRAYPDLERQMRSVLGLLEQLGARATFFVLGMTARNYPGLLEQVAERGHEVASHGYAHRRVFRQTAEEFRHDLELGVAVIERALGKRPIGYRAPAFSINRDSLWAYEILADAGFLYDSSQYDSPRIPRRLQQIPSHAYRLELSSGRSLWEFPITVWRVGGRSVPVGGGSYWRVLPAPVIMRALASAADAGAHPVLYLHPYECDPLPLRAHLPSGPSARQRFGALYRSLYRNPGRRRIVPTLREVARDFRLVSYETLFADIRERGGARTRALSAEGVLV